MKLSIEISLYPLAEEQFKAEIWSFIRKLRAQTELNVVTNGMSTQVFGDYDLCLSTVMAEVKRVHQTVNSAVFVIKLVNGDRRNPEVEI